MRRGRHTDVLHGLAILALVLVGASAGAGADAPAGSAATLAPGPTVFVSAGGSDANPCSALAPCASFNRAYRVAAPGASVAIEAGTYPGQTIEEDATKTSSKHVVFMPASRSDVVTILGSLDFGRSRGAKHVTVRNLQIVGEIRASSRSTDLLWENIDAASFLIDGATKITVRGGDFGPCRAGPGIGCVSKVAGATASSILVEGARFHDITSSDATRFHVECLFIRGGTDITIRRSSFANCEVFDIFLQGQPEVARLSRIRIEGNWFDAPLKGDGGRRDTAISFSGDRPFQDVVIRNNSFIESGILFTDRVGPDGYPGTRVVSNIFGHGMSRCPASVSFEANVLSGGGKCGSEERDPPFGYQVDRGALVASDVSAKAVRRVFAEAGWRRELKRVVLAMRRARLPSPAGRGWTATSVRRLLTDRAYLGGAYGARGAHPALVNRKVWVAAQKLVRKR